MSGAHLPPRRRREPRGAAAAVPDLPEAAIVSAGAVVWRHGDSGVELCLVHRPKYDDWTLPKGKVDPGEHVLACAVREVAEETGYRVALGPPLPTQRYLVNDRPKIVYYWAAHAAGDRGPWHPTHEVDDAVFVALPDALRRLSYPNDAEVVAALAGTPSQTTPLVLLRHTKAVDRGRWRRPDDERPLTAEGAAAAQRLVAPLGALGLSHVVSSPAVRCTDTVRPYAAHRGLSITVDPALSEDVRPAESVRPSAVVHKLLASEEPTLVCSHRPVLPELLAAATDAATRDAATRDAGAVSTEPLPQGGFHVVHCGPGSAVAVDTHRI